MSENPNEAGPGERGASSQSPAVPKTPTAAQQWIPVTAEDVASQRRRKILQISAAVVLLAGAGWFIYNRSLSPLEGQQALDAGSRLYKSANYQQAILNFNRAIEMNPKSVEAHLTRARALTAEGELPKAIQDFSKVIELSPRDVSALLERGLLYLSTKDYAHAISDASRALAIDPKLARAYNLRATAVRDAGDPRKSIDDFNRAVENDPNLDNLFQRAATYQQMNQHGPALADFDRALELAPDQPHIYYARARSRQATGDTKGAAKDFEVARKIDNF